MTKTKWHQHNHLRACELMQRNTLACDRSNPKTGQILALQLADLNLSVREIRDFMLTWWNVGQFDLDKLTEFARVAVEGDLHHGNR